MAAWAGACAGYDEAINAGRACRVAWLAAATNTPDRDTRRRKWQATVPTRGVAHTAVRNAHACAFLAYSAAHGPDVAGLFLTLTPQPSAGPGRVEAVIAALLAPPALRCARSRERYET
jgi:hypothetical protein